MPEQPSRTDCESLSETKPKACAHCLTKVTEQDGDDALVEVLAHYLHEHPHDDTLIDILTGQWVKVECRDCGLPFFSPVSYGGGKIGAEAYCPECDGEGIRAIMAQTLAPQELIEREADPTEDDLEREAADDE